MDKLHESRKIYNGIPERCKLHNQAKSGRRRQRGSTIDGTAGLVKIIKPAVNF